MEKEKEMGKIAATRPTARHLYARMRTSNSTTTTTNSSNNNGDRDSA